MVSIVPSRFAGLKIEDDDDDEVPQPKKSNKNQNKSKTNQTQTPANQNGKPANKNNKKQNQPKRKKGNGVNDEQWKQWQERDKELVDNTYEKDLEHALLLSKLDLEEKKSGVEKADKDKKTKPGTKGKKQQPMNLQQFNQLMEDQTQPKVLSIQDPPKKSNFFENINEQAKNILRKEELQSIGQTQKNKIPTETDNKTDKLPVQTTVELDTNREMEQLREENVKLKQELDALKEKCKKVATILKNAEVKEKVELALEISNLKKTQEDMSNEMAKLYIELEQEKSRATQAMQHHSNSGGQENKGSRSAMRKSVRFDEQSFSENQ